jgi:hypothetical protein
MTMTTLESEPDVRKPAPPCMGCGGEKAKCPCCNRCERAPGACICEWLPEGWKGAHHSYQVYAEQQRDRAQL